MSYTAFISYYVVFFLLFTPLLLPFICIYDVIENILRAQGNTTLHTYIMYDIIFNNNPACVGENFVSRATWKPSNAAAYTGKPPPFSTLDFICTLHWFTPLNCACVKSHVWPPLYFVLQIGAAHEYCIKLYGKRIPNATGMSCCSLHSSAPFHHWIHAGLRFAWVTSASRCTYVLLALITPQIIPLKWCLQAASLTIFMFLLWFCITRSHGHHHNMSSPWTILPALCFVFISSIWHQISITIFNSCFTGSHSLCTLLQSCLPLVYYIILNIVLLICLHITSPLLFLIIRLFLLSLACCY